jgi:hypothetical protein
MKKNELVIDIFRTKEEFLKQLSQYKHPLDYIRVSQSDKFDVCLELTWQQHSKPYVEYLYLANIIGNQVVGEIVKPTHNDIIGGKLKFKEKLEAVGFIFLGVAFIYGIPFFIIYAISGMLLLSIGLAMIPLIIIIFFLMFKSNHLQMHKENIIVAFRSIGS